MKVTLSLLFIALLSSLVAQDYFDETKKFTIGNARCDTEIGRACSNITIQNLLMGKREEKKTTFDDLFASDDEQQSSGKPIFEFSLAGKLGRLEEAIQEYNYQMSEDKAAQPEALIPNKMPKTKWERERMESTFAYWMKRKSYIKDLGKKIADQYGLGDGYEKIDNQKSREQFIANLANTKLEEGERDPMMQKVLSLVKDGFSNKNVRDMDEALKGYFSENDISSFAGFDDMDEVNHIMRHSLWMQHTLEPDKPSMDSMVMKGSPPPPPPIPSEINSDHSDWMVSRWQRKHLKDFKSPEDFMKKVKTGDWEILTCATRSAGRENKYNRGDNFKKAFYVNCPATYVRSSVTPAFTKGIAKDFALPIVPQRKIDEFKNNGQFLAGRPLRIVDGQFKIYGPTTPSSADPNDEFLDQLSRPEYKKHSQQLAADMQILSDMKMKAENGRIYLHANEHELLGKLDLLGSKKTDIGTKFDITDISDFYLPKIDKGQTRLRFSDETKQIRMKLEMSKLQQYLAAKRQSLALEQFTDDKVIKIEDLMKDSLKERFPSQPDRVIRLGQFNDRSSGGDFSRPDSFIIGGKTPNQEIKLPEQMKYELLKVVRGQAAMTDFESQYKGADNVLDSIAQMYNPLVVEAVKQSDRNMYCAHRKYQKTPIMCQNGSMYVLLKDDQDRLKFNRFETLPYLLDQPFINQSGRFNDGRMQFILPQRNNNFNDRYYNPTRRY